MQSMCLQTCYQLGGETRETLMSVSLDASKMRRVLEHTATTADFSTLLDAFHAGPKLRGQERNQFRFKDGSEGDVYRCVLLALADNPPKLSLRYDEIYTRTRTVCVANAPVGSSVNEAVTQVHKIAEAVQPLSRVIEWSGDVLDIADPFSCSLSAARRAWQKSSAGAMNREPSRFSLERTSPRICLQVVVVSKGRVLDYSRHMSPVVCCAPQIFIGLTRTDPALRQPFSSDPGQLRVWGWAVSVVEVHRRDLADSKAARDRVAAPHQHGEREKEVGPAG